MEGSIFSVLRGSAEETSIRRVVKTYRCIREVEENQQYVPQRQRQRLGTTTMVQHPRILAAVLLPMMAAEEQSLASYAGTDPSKVGHLRPNQLGMHFQV